MQTEGVFGVALGVSTSMIFLFVLFGALLEKAGAGNYFIKLSFCALGHLKGDQQKQLLWRQVYQEYIQALQSQMLLQLVPLQSLNEKTGFTPEKAGAIEVASSTNGQLTPPVMGAAAFLISEFTNVSYFELIKYAALPALASTLLYFILSI